MNPHTPDVLRQTIWRLVAAQDTTALSRAQELTEALPLPGAEPDELTAQCIFDVAFAMEGIGRDRAAMELYRRVLEYPVSNTKYTASAWFRVGVCLCRQGNLLEAVRCYRQTLHLARNEPYLEALANYSLAVLLEADEQHAEAASLYSKVILELPHPDINPSRVSLSRARCFWRSAHEDEAVADLIPLAERREDPEAVEAWRLLAEIAESRRDYRAAEKAYREVMDNPHAEISLRAGAAYRLAAIADQVPRSTG